MKITPPLLATVSAILLACTANLQAQYSSDVRQPQPGPPPGPPPGSSGSYYVPYITGPLYAGVEIGGTLLQNMRVKNNGTTMSFDPGTRFDLNFGFYATEQISFEFETGAMWNSVRRTSSQPLTATGQNADFYQVPLLVNMIFHAPLPGGCSLYFGAGGGGVVSDLYISSGFHNRNYSDDSDVTLAYQAMAGFKWPVARRMEVGVGYKFMGTMDHTFYDGDPVLFTHTSPAYSHSILASFKFSF